MNHQAHIKIVKECYEAFLSGDIPIIIENLSNTIDWIVPGKGSEIPYAGIFHGKEQVMKFLGIFTDSSEYELFEPREFVAQNNKVVVLGHSKIIASGSGKKTEYDWIHYFTFSDNKVIRFQEFIDTYCVSKIY